MNKISQLIKSFGYAIKGITAAVRMEQNMQIHLIAVIVVTLAGVWLEVSVAEWMVLVLCFGMVIGGELMNSAIEKLVDLVSPEYHAKAGMIKDMAAGAVLVLALAAAITGGFIFIPKLT
ncbi:MAG: diacylglycerol kinase family protein [Bacteroidota bacterium]